MCVCIEKANEIEKLVVSVYRCTRPRMEWPRIPAAMPQLLEVWPAAAYREWVAVLHTESCKAAAAECLARVQTGVDGLRDRGDDISSKR